MADSPTPENTDTVLHKNLPTPRTMYTTLRPFWTPGTTKDSPGVQDRWRSGSMSCWEHQAGIPWHRMAQLPEEGATRSARGK